MSNLFEQDQWDSGYTSRTFKSLPSDDVVAQWMRRFLRHESGLSCLEVGCFPGGHLALCGEQGYELNGVDLTPRTPEMIPWLTSRKLSVGKIEAGDFFKFDPGRLYDLVYSNGFIEHFTEWEGVLEKHASWVKPGGLLLITTPNFAGSAQHFLHSKLDDLNLSRHYLPSMNPILWAKLLEDKFEILETGYFGGFRFWIGEQSRSLPKRLAFYSVRAIIPLIRPFIPNGRSFSAYCGIAARRKIKH